MPLIELHSDPPWEVSPSTLNVLTPPHCNIPLTKSFVLTNSGLFSFGDSEGVKTLRQEAEMSSWRQDFSIIWEVNRFILLSSD